MRLFSEKENRILEKLVEYKKTGNLKELQVAPLLRKNLSALAIVWTIEPKPTIKVYSVSKNVNEAVKHYLSIVNFIYFIQELDRIGYIHLVDVPSDRIEKQRELYDRSKYDFIPDKNQFVEKGIDKENGILSLMGDFEYNLFGKTEDAEFISPLTVQSFPISFTYDLDSIAYKIIYPMPVLEEYVNSGFKTIEDKRFEHNLKLSENAIKISNKTLIISLLAFLASIAAILTSIYFGKKQLETPTLLDDSQLQRIENTIKNSSKIVSPVPITSSDTLKVEYITKQQKQ